MLLFRFEIRLVRQRPRRPGAARHVGTLPEACRKQCEVRCVSTNAPLSDTAFQSCQLRLGVERGGETKVGAGMGGGRCQAGRSVSQVHEVPSQIW